MTEWQGDNPFFLYLRDEAAVIDLDEPRWKETYSELLRACGVWQLIIKNGAVVIEVYKNDDDGLRYVSRVFTYPHFGNKVLRAYGFVRDSGEVWYMPWSGLCTDGRSLTQLADRQAWATWGQVQLSVP